MDKGQRYIDAVADLYNLQQQARATLESGVGQINDVLDNYYWNDIDAAINYYYTHISDKARPKISQIRAILADWVRMERIETVARPAPSVPPVTHKLPTTGIWSIKDTFDKLIKTMVKCGVLRSETESERATGALIDPATHLPILCPRQWLRHQVEQAKRTSPDIFAKFDNLTEWEALALALQNNLVTFNIRNYGSTA